MIEQGLARLFPRSFTARLLSVAFVGIHVPLILLAGWMIFTSQLGVSAMLRMFLIVLAATLVGTAATTLVLYRLLAPLRIAAKALDDYYAKGELPELPNTGQDEIGRLLRGINRSIHGLDDGLRVLQDQAHSDPLTNTLNRRGSEQVLMRSLDMLSRSPEPFTLFVIDMDNLKQINDRSGHASGDAALVHLVESARQWLGERDWLGRWGGDEFLIGLHEDESVALDRVRQWMAELTRAGGNNDEQAIEVSAGAASWRKGLSADVLYREADAAMYRAKFSGGGKLVVAQTEMAESGSDCCR